VAVQEQDELHLATLAHEDVATMRGPRPDRLLQRPTRGGGRIGQEH
jgi:hypothetical protein